MWYFILHTRKNLIGTQGATMNSLTSREREIVFALAEGLSNKDIGRRLGLSEGTVKVHLHNIYSKLGVKNRTALVVLAHTEFGPAPSGLLAKGPTNILENPRRRGNPYAASSSRSFAQPSA
jgi:DNA-binding CsgD family transcriptional regulator